MEKCKAARKKEYTQIGEKIASLERQLKNSSAVARGHKIAISKIISHVRSTNRKFLRIWHNRNYTHAPCAGPAPLRATFLMARGTPFLGYLPAGSPLGP